MTLPEAEDIEGFVGRCWEKKDVSIGDSLFHGKTYWAHQADMNT